MHVNGLLWLVPTVCDNLPEVFEVDAVLGACFLIKRNVLDLIGLLDEGFSPFLHEESDYCIRARKAGFKICTLPSVKLVHIGSASMNKIETNYVYFVIRKNEIRFMLLNFPTKWLIYFLPYIIRKFLSCFIIIDRKKGNFPFKINKDWRNRMKAYVEAWIINLKSLREIIPKRRNRMKKIESIC